MASASTAALYAAIGGTFTVRLSLASGYAGLVFLAVTLALGPINILRNRPNPVSTRLRRDIGIWAALLAIGHLIFALQNHMNGNIRSYFLWPSRSGALPLREDAFGIANHLGLLAGVVLLALLALSNDASMARLGISRWKSLQRFTYLAAVAVALHTALFMALTGRPNWLVLGIGAGMLAVLGLQAAGVLSVRGGRYK